MNDILVVKLGGSSASSPDLPRWIASLEKATSPLVVVPGGGPFANTVRRYQPRMGYDDEAAHEMAILAMEQFGCALVSLGTRMEKASDEQEIAAILGRGGIAVWMPGKGVLSAPDISKDWTVTSDSLAAWLAGRLEGARLCLVKQLDLPSDIGVSALVGAHVVDASFARLLSDRTELSVAGPADLSRCGRMLALGDVPGNRVARGSSSRAAFLRDAAE